MRAYGNDKNRASNRLPRYRRNLEDNKNNQYSSNQAEDNKITKTIVQYQDDPEKSSALARVRKMSEQSKSRRNSPKSSDEEVENTEKNRLLFKNNKEEEEEEPVFKKKEPKKSLRKVHFGEKGEEKNNNTIDNIRIKKIDDIDDEIIPKNNTQEEIRQVDSYKNKNDNNDRNNKTNENNNLNIVNSYRNRKYKYNRNYNISRNPENNITDINNNKVKYNTIDNDNNNNNYNLRNSEVVESHHNKDKIIVNEYRTKSKNKKDLKKYKTEYVWDKNINRLVEKRIYLDDNDIADDNNNEKEEEDEDENDKRPYTQRYRNRPNKYEIKDSPKNDDNEEKEKEIEKEKAKSNRFNSKENKNDEEEDKEEFRPYRKKNKEPKLLEYTIEKIKKDKIEPEKLKGKDSRVLEVRKRFGNCQVIFKKEQKAIKNKNNNKNEKKFEKVEKDNYRTLDNTSKNKPKELNKTNDSVRFYRKGKRYTVDEDKPKQEKKEIIKETRPKYQIKKPNNTYSEVVIEERTTINDGKPKVEVSEIRYQPNSKIYQKRQYITNNDDDFKMKMPKAFMGEKKYLKRPSYTPLDQMANTVYTKKIIEEKKPDKKEVKEIFIEKNYEDNSNERGNPYNFKKKNIKIQMVSEKLEDDGNNINTKYQKYTKNSKNAKTGKMFISSKFEDNFNDFNKKEFLPSYDDINEIMDEEFRNFAGFNKYEIRPGDDQEKPYYKKKVQVDEVRGNNDVLKKFSKSQERYENEFDD